MQNYFSVFIFYFYSYVIISEQVLLISDIRITPIFQNDKSIKEDKKSVIIVGAGIAGISAATLLLQNNISDILVLEASDRIGGRISTSFFEDAIIDYGAQWVLGGKGNPVYELSAPYNVLLSNDEDDDNYDFRTSSTSGVNMTQFYDLYELLYTIFDDRDSLSQTNGSMADYFNSRFEYHVKKLGIEKNTADAVKDFLTKLTNAFIGSDRLEDAGVLGFSRYLDIDGNTTYSWKTGFQTFIDILLGKYDGRNMARLLENKIEYNKVVQNIKWSGLESKGVELTCEDGSKYFADHVIVTVSLGVLQHSASFMFTPPLPTNKLSAIQSFGMGTVEKIFLKFPNSWWSKNGLDLSFIWTEEEREAYRNQSTYGGWPTHILGFHNINKEPNVLQGWIIGEAAREMENFSDDIILAVCTDILKKFIPEANISKPTNITRTHWHKNRFYYGSYSFATVESDRLNLTVVDLAQPVTNNDNIPVVLFAGESTHEKFYATVHGALESGWREALRILKIKNIKLFGSLKNNLD